MNKFSYKKNLAFTLAEMMVVLTLFSVISAATLPVITAKNNIDMSEDSTASGYFPDPWKESSNGTLSYYNTGSPLANKSAVIVGGKVSDDAYAIGYPQLIVKDNNVGNNIPYQSSQIVLTKQFGNSGYIGGRIILSNPERTNFYSKNYGNIGLGYESMYTPNNNYAERSKTISIGNYAGAVNGLNDVKVNSILIGNHPDGDVFSLSDGAENHTAYSTIIGNYSGTSEKGVRSVCIGNYTGGGSILESLHLGEYAGYQTNISDESVAVGTYAGSKMPNSIDNVSLGYFSGYGYSSRSSSLSVYVGSYAGAYTNLNASDGGHYTRMIAIGKNAGRNIKNSKNIHGSIYLGNNAGENSYTSRTSTSNKTSSTIMIGSYSGYYAGNSNAAKAQYDIDVPLIIGYYAGSNNNGISGSQTKPAPEYPVIIGTYAFSNNLDESGASMPAVTIGAYAGFGMQSGGSVSRSVFIGNYAGANVNNNLHYSVCIGYNACYGALGTYDVRIAPSHSKIWPFTKAIMGDPNTGKLRSGTSYIGYPYASSEVFPLVLPPHLGDPTPTPFVALTEVKKKLFDTDSVESNLVLSPFSEDYKPADASNSSIILYAEHVYGPSGGIVTYSDKRLKENIKPLRYGLKDIRNINIYEYKWKYNDTGKLKIGVIAQELQKIIPESIYKSPDGYLAINPDWILFPMFTAIQELDKSLISIQNNFKLYLKDYVSLVSRVKVLEKEVRMLEKENKALTRDVNIAYRKAKRLEVKQ